LEGTTAPAQHSTLGQYNSAKGVSLLQKPEVKLKLFTEIPECHRLCPSDASSTVRPSLKRAQDSQLTIPSKSPRHHLQKTIPPKPSQQDKRKGRPGGMGLRIKCLRI